MLKKHLLNKIDWYEDFYSFVLGQKTRFGDRDGVCWFSRSGDASKRTFSRLSDDALAFAAGLREAGLSGKHIAIAGENCYEWIVSFLGITISGGIAVCVDVEQPDDILLFMIRTGDSDAVIVSSSLASICAPLSQNGTTLISMHASDPFSVAGLTERGKNHISALSAPDGNSPAAIVFTSGTTSTHKPVLLSHTNILHNARQSTSMVLVPPTVFSGLPFYHAYGLTCGIFGNLLTGSTLWINGDLKYMMRDLVKSECEGMVAVPLMVENLYRALWWHLDKCGKKDEAKKLLKKNLALRPLTGAKPDKLLKALKEEAIGKVRVMVCGGAHIRPEICEQLIAFDVLVLPGYGITECSPLLSANMNKSFNMKSVGYALPYMELRVVDGEIWARGDSVMLGYYNCPEETSETFSDGWFKTGDLGYCDRHGFFYITGRKKNLIVFENGKKISCERVEELVSAIPMVREVMAYGATSGENADCVKLAVNVYPDPVLTEGMSTYDILENLHQEIDKINAGLPSYQQIQMINIREQEFEKTSTRKIKRHIV